MMIHAMIHWNVLDSYLLSWPLIASAGLLQAEVLVNHPARGNSGCTYRFEFEF